MTAILSLIGWIGLCGIIFILTKDNVEESEWVRNMMSI